MHNSGPFPSNKLTRVTRWHCILHYSLMWYYVDLNVQSGLYLDIVFQAQYAHSPMKAI